ncbi:MAG TPA: hypothetical protein VFX76_06530 [Roseiflexaceae bacterium]|nr:hypothetical protein [Roseiflexaceae bacterium]
MSQASTNGRPWWLRPGCVAAIVLPVLLLAFGLWIYLAFYQGRDISRVTGRPVQIALPDCVRSAEQVISVSFHSDRAGETIKDLTYVCDGQLFSREFNDFGILQGSIEWTFTQR